MLKQKHKKIPVKMKVYNFRNFIFEFSNFFWYDCFFDLWKNVVKNRISRHNKLFWPLLFVSSVDCWWMTLDCFTCISVIFQAIKFVRWALESLDFEDSKNMWFFSKSIDPGWVWAKTKKVICVKSRFFTKKLVLAGTFLFSDIKTSIEAHFFQ